MSNEIKLAEIDDCGDLICPYCSVGILTPEGATLVSGIAECTVCGNEFRIEVKNEKDKA